MSLNGQPTVAAVLNSLKETIRARDIQRGRQLHLQAINTGLLSSTYVANTLINMYAKCRSMTEAHKLFDALAHQRDVVTWNCLIQGYVDNGLSDTALELYEALEHAQSGCVPNSKTYLAALTACGSLAARGDGDRQIPGWLARGKSIHTQAVKRRCCDLRVGTTLVGMYSKCGSLRDAREAFDRMAQRDVACWNCMIQGYVENGQSQEAIQMFERMEQECAPDARTYVAVLTACSTLAESDVEKRDWLEKAQAVHLQAERNTCCEVFVYAALINVYGKCKCTSLARGVFERMTRRDTATWTCLIQAYVENGESETALEVYDRMESGQGDCLPGARTYVAALTACASLAEKEGGDTERWLAKGREIYFRAKRSSVCDVFVENTMIDLFSRGRSMTLARDVFDSMQRKTVVSWNALLQGYVDNGENEIALELFESMKTECCPNARTYVAALNACARLGTAARDAPGETNRDWLRRGRDIHSLALQRRCCNFVVETTLVDMYSSCGSTSEARHVFDKMAQRDLVCWNCLARGYVVNGENELALELISRMETKTFATFVAALTACGNTSAVRRGRELHAEAERCGLKDESAVAVALMEFYGKTGSMEAAEEVFESLPVRDVWCWNALLSGYGQQGEALHVLELFEEMVEQSIRPNECTFTQVLTACSHAGMTEKGRELFERMECEYGVSRDLMHYNCLVDLLARANAVEEAVKAVKVMPFEANSVTWTAILDGCRRWNKFDVGKVACEQLVRLNAEGSERRHSEEKSFDQMEAPFFH